MEPYTVASTYIIVNPDDTVLVGGTKQLAAAVERGTYKSLHLVRDGVIRPIVVNHVGGVLHQVVAEGVEVERFRTGEKGTS